MVKLGSTHRALFVLSTRTESNSFVEIRYLLKPYVFTIFLECHLEFVINFYLLHQAMEQQLKGGAMPRAWYREHAHPVLLPLDEEENHLLR
jgi:hypothetical protein